MDTAPIEASFTLCDRLNPSLGYQVRIWQGLNALLFTSVAPDTGDDLLTAADCMKVISMYLPSDNPVSDALPMFLQPQAE